MERQQLINKIEEFSGALGPEGYDDFDFTNPLERENTWVESLDKIALIDGLVDLITHPPVNDIYTVMFTKQNLEDSISDLLELLAEKGYAETIFDKLKPYLANIESSYCFMLLGSLGYQASIDFLEKKTLEMNKLSDDNLRWLAYALGKTGEEKAKLLLKGMSKNIPLSKVDIHNEIKSFLRE